MCVGPFNRGRITEAVTCQLDTSETHDRHKCEQRSVYHMFIYFWPDCPRHVLKRSAPSPPAVVFVLFNPSCSAAPPICSACTLSQTGPNSHTHSISHTAAAKIIGLPTPVLSELSCKAITHFANTIVQDITHALHCCPLGAEGLAWAKAWYLQPYKF